MKKTKIKTFTKKQLETMFIEHNMARFTVAVTKARKQSHKLERALAELESIADLLSPLDKSKEENK